jgi:hypothetical protein
MITLITRNLRVIIIFQCLFYTGCYRRILYYQRKSTVSNISKKKPQLLIAEALYEEMLSRKLL